MAEDITKGRFAEAKKKLKAVQQEAILEAEERLRAIRERTMKKFEKV